jgi:glycosyltransferase involved in cell wall biosynthesis
MARNGGKELMKFSGRRKSAQRRPGPVSGAVAALKGERRRALRVLVTGPLLEKPGGVAQYLRVVLPFLHVSAEHFVIGSRCEDESPMVSLLRLWADWFAFVRRLQREKFDLVHLNPSLGVKALVRDGVLLLLAKAWGKRVLVFLHGWDEVCEQRFVRPAAWLFRAVYGRADGIAVLGSEFARKLRSLGYQKSILFQTLPVQKELWKRSPEESAKRTEKKDMEFRILFLARVERKKGIYEALDAYRLVKRFIPSATLTVAGDGSELARAREYARQAELTGISFRGHVSGQEKAAVFQGADVYLFPSYSEGLPISVLEAMVSGLPIVTTRVGGLPDFFEDGKMGYGLTGAQPERAAEILCQLWTNPRLRSEMSRFNASYARRHFHPRRVAVQLEEAYERVLGGAQ